MNGTTKRRSKPSLGTIPFTESAWIPSSSILQEERVTRLLDEGHTVELVYLDFAKAFDSVNHRFLLAKLKSSGIDGAVQNWI